MSHASNKVTVSLELSVNDGRLIMEALSEQPFKYVFELVGKLNHQANMLTSENGRETTTHSFELTGHDLELILRSLGEMPYNKVSNIIETIQAQVSEQRK